MFLIDLGEKAQGIYKVQTLSLAKVPRMVENVGFSTRGSDHGKGSVSAMRYLTKDEAYLFNQGKLYDAYLRFGAHIISIDEKEGVHFAVYAPHAKQVYVAGDFNGWQATHAMCADESGVWTLFVEGLSEGVLYKYLVETQSGELVYKSDPFAFYSQRRPDTASIVYELEGFKWADKAWLNKKEKQNILESPLNIYEVHLGSWKKHGEGENDFYTYDELSHELVGYVKDMGYTHIELMPLAEHPFDGSWGYQSVGYYSMTSRYGDPKSLMRFINECHKAGIGVLMDWAGGHFCPDAHGLGLFDGSPLYESEKHAHWGTYKFNFDKNEVRSYLISNAVFLAEKFHIDGIRVDGVSSMIYLDFDKDYPVYNKYGGRENLAAVDFLKELNSVLLTRYQGFLMIAEESTDFPMVTKPPYDGGLGFNLKWNMGWMNDSLKYAEEEFENRQHHHHLITFSSMYNFSENFILPFSHDEVVHGKKSMIDKMPGDLWRKFASLRAFGVFQMTFPGKKLNFMGNEFAQFIEWKYYDQLEWFMLDYDFHRKYQDFVREINHLYKGQKAFWNNDLSSDTFRWIDADNAQQSIFTYERYDKDGSKILVVLNMQPEPYHEYRIGVDEEGVYTELVNSDSEAYAGSGFFMNTEPVKVEDFSIHGKPYSICVQVPPLGGLCFKFKKKAGRKVTKKG